jgi:tight adherence protein C
MDLFVITVATFGFFGSLLYATLGPRGSRAGDAVRSRLEAIAEAGAVGGAADAVLRSVGGGFWESLAGYFVDGRGAVKDGKLARLLHQAGYRPERAAPVFVGIRVLAAIAGAGAAFFLAAAGGTSFFRLVVAMAAAAGFASIVPLAILQRQARLRLRDMEETFPDTLDLLVVCVEAGLGTDAALLRVAEEQASHGLAIGHELLLACRESQAGIPRREALTRMANRLGSDPIHSLTRFLVQTEELGGSIARSLRVYATTMRQRRRQKAEELVRKLVIRLLFPLALLIMPALFMVVFAPPVVNIVKFVGSQSIRGK